MRQGWTLLLVLCLFSACAKEKKEETGWSSFPVVIYSDAALVATAESREDLNRAFAYWEEKAGRRLFDFQGEWKGGTPYGGSPQSPTQISANVIFFQNPWPFSAQTAGQTTVISTKGTIQGSLIMLNESIARCSGECQGEHMRISQQKLLAHELGHFLGLQHSGDASDIMYPSISPGGSLGSTGTNVAALQQMVQ